MGLNGTMTKLHLGGRTLIPSPTSAPGTAKQEWCHCISVVLEATHKASQGPLKGAASAQKVIQGSETETRELLGGNTKNRVSPQGVIASLNQ